MTPPTMTTPPTKKDLDKLRLMLSLLNEQSQPNVNALIDSFACTCFDLLVRKAA